MRSYDQFCALSKSLDVVGGRWTLLVVRELLLGPRRFSDLREALPGIANNLLAQRLRELEAEGLVRRRALPAPGPSQVYELTPRGQALEEVVFALMRWGAEYMTPRPRDSFRPQWLALVLRAYLPSRVGRDARVRAEVRADDARIGIDSTSGQVHVALEPGHPADVSVDADPQTLLAVASGALPWDEASRGGALRIVGPPEHGARLERLFATVSPR